MSTIRVTTARLPQRNHRTWIASAAAPWICFASAFIVAATSAAQDAVLVPFDTAYAANDINHVAFRQNAITSVVVGQDTYQFAAYYRHTGAGRRITLARRVLGVSDWEVFDFTGSAFGDPNSNATDSHNAINIGIDGDGYMHMAWGMHDDPLLYRRSTAPVTNSNPIAFSTINESMTGANENSVTYPQFYNLPDGDLLYFYRNGGSGNGNTYLNRYDVATDSWSAVQHPLFDGLTSSVNAYFNSLAFDASGNLHATWTDRSTPAFQTNHHIYYARSPDQGLTWTKMDGTPYTLPITEATAELVVPIPEGSSLINQASMTVDSQGRPIVATWWAPGAQQGDHTRQYMLAYFDGVSWETSQITNRPPEPMDTGANVRDLARPIVLVDDDDRTIVVMRYDQRGNVVTIGYSEDKQNWNLLDLTTEDLGIWEPTYDAELWKRENKLHLLYQPVGLGSTNSTISVLEWDARAFFFEPEVPITLEVNRLNGTARIVNPNEDPADISAYSIGSPGGQLDPAAWNSLHDQAMGGWLETQSEPSGLAESNSTGSFSLGAGEAIPLGRPFVGQQLAFGVNGPDDLTFAYSLDGEPISGTVLYVGDSPNNLTLFVDQESGRARLENTSAFPVAIDAYTITSASDSLDPDGWVSLDDQDVEAGQWFEANLEPGRIAELQMDGFTLLEPGEGYDLGHVFDVAEGEPDLAFEFLIEDVGVPTLGAVRYARLGLQGDYNGDLVVDAGDYVTWRNSLGQLVSFGVGADGNRDGYVGLEDYDIWKSRYGNRELTGSGNAHSISTIPEPSTLVIVAWLVATRALVWLRRQ